MGSAALLTLSLAYAITAGLEHSCGRRGNYYLSSPPGGSFAAVTAGMWYSCGLGGDGRLLGSQELRAVQPARWQLCGCHSRRFVQLLSLIHI